MSNRISGLNARMVLDSRGNPTVEVDCYVDGRSVGSHDASYRLSGVKDQRGTAYCLGTAVLHVLSAPADG